MKLLSLIAAVSLAALCQTPTMPGELVDAGGYRVHLYCTGEGSPTVFIAGQGFSFDWALVQPEIAKITRVCTYDPAGTAWSDPGPAITCKNRVAEIRNVLGNAHIPRPYVLVGFSFGGLVVRSYAHAYPNDLAAIVLVDHAFLQPTDQAPSMKITAPGVDTPPVLIHQEPIVFSVEETSAFNNLPERSRELHHWATSLHPALPSGEIAEQCSAEIDKAEGRADPLGNLPLFVVSTGNDSPNYPKLQAKLLALSHDSKQLIASHSFHSVEIDQPDVVVSAIRQAVAAVRNAK